MTSSERRTRPDRAKAAIVNQGIDMADRAGFLAAASFMNRSGVPLKVLVRALCEPELRRPTTYR